MTKKFIAMCEIYKIFAKDWDCSFTNKDMEELYLYESKGIGDISIMGFNASGKKPNGYAVGKKWLNVQVSMWKESFRKNRTFARMCLEQMYQKNEFPRWWLDNIFMIPEFENMVNDIKKYPTKREEDEKQHTITCINPYNI